MTKVDYDARAVATVACPQCGAPVGEKCRGAYNKHVMYTHVRRRNVAAEKVGTRRTA